MTGKATKYATAVDAVDSPHMRILQATILTAAIGLFGCTKPNPAASCPTGVCSDPNLYCDINGAIAGEPRRCLFVDCTPGELGACDGDTALVCADTGRSYDESTCGAGCDDTSGCRPFCAAGAAIECVDDELTRCNDAGTATVRQQCALGCSTNEARCLSFEPSNGLGPALVDSATAPDLVLPANTRIDTTLGIVQDGAGTTLQVTSARVNQAGGASIFVLEGRSISMSDVTVVGTSPLAFVASDAITVRGRIAVRAQGRTGGAGAQSTTTCNGQDNMQFSCVCAPDLCSAGAGGAGNHQAGGRGGAASTANGGNALAGFSPLIGGCAGGAQRSANGSTVLFNGGGGGGAVQFVAGNAVVLTEQGLVDVGGGGGQSTAGGGSGGLVVIEAPRVSIAGPAAGVVANGGAGGGCGMTGPDATSNTNQAPGAVCANYFAGSGGTGTRAPGNGCLAGIENCNGVCPVIYGGGGGSVGRMRLATKDGAFESSGTPTLSVKITTATLSPR